MSDGDQGPVRALARLTGLGLMLGVFVALGAVAGYYLDRKFGTEPWGMIVGMLLGIAAGFFEVITTALKAERDETQAQEKHDGRDHGKG